MSENGWVVARGNDRYNAPDVATLQSWAKQGNVFAEDQIFNPLSGQWNRAKDTPEVAEHIVRPTPVAAPPVAAISTNPATNLIGLRAVDYLIDVIPAIILGLFGFIPLLGPIIAGLLVGTYWLFRDGAGRSLGKMAVGLVVVDAQGNVPEMGARVKRNLPFAIAAYAFAIPLLGYFLGPLLGFAAFLTEVIMLATQGERLGDRFAGTRVVKAQA